MESARYNSPHNFFLAFIDELEKQIVIKKLLKWANKKQNEFNICNVAFFKKKIKKNTCRYHYQNPNDMIYSSWDIEQNMQKLVILGHFLPFYSPKITKIKILKTKKFAGDIIILSKITITWYMVPEIGSETGRIFCYFGPFLALLPSPHPLYWSFYTCMCTINEDHVIYGSWNIRCDRQTKFWKHEKNARRYYHFTHVYHKWQLYDVCFLRYGVWLTEFFVILDHFVPFYSPKTPKNQNFEKMEKTAGDIITLHKCTKNHDYMLHCSCDTMHDGCNSFFLFWAFFALLPA